MREDLWPAAEGQVREMILEPDKKAQFSLGSLTTHVIPFGHLRRLSFNTVSLPRKVVFPAVSSSVSGRGRSPGGVCKQRVMI